MTYRSAIYRGSVVHERFRPRKHRLRYTVFTLLLDLDELVDLDQEFRVFAYNRRSLVSFHDADHGPANGQPLRPWVEARLAEAGVEIEGGAIRLLCYPRVLGHVFNPLSVYFCHRPDDDLAAILYEVCNTFGERHTYVIPVTDDGRSVIRQSCDKAHYVSPFIDMDALYRFRILPPRDKVSVTIRQEDSEGLLLAAAFAGEREEFTQRSLLKHLLRLPLLSLKVVSAIHWEALKMWLKGFPVYRHRPAAAPVASSVGQPLP